MSHKTYTKKGLFTEDFILYSELKLTERILLADIYTMTKLGTVEYFKLNETIGILLGCGISSVKIVLNSLEKKGFIRRVYKRYAGTIKTERRIIIVQSKILELKNNYKK